VDRFLVGGLAVMMIRRNEFFPWYREGSNAAKEAGKPPVISMLLTQGSHSGRYSTYFKRSAGL